VHEKILGIIEMDFVSIIVLSTVGTGIIKPREKASEIPSLG